MVERHETEAGAKEIVADKSKPLAQRSGALVSRGLRELSSSDLDFFCELGKALTSSLLLDEVLRLMMEKLDELFHPDTWQLLLVDESKKELYFELAVGSEGAALRDRRVQFGEGIAGWVAENSETVVTLDAKNDPRFRESVDARPGADARTMVAVPLRFQEHCLGVLELLNFRGPAGPSQRDLSLLHAFADFAAVALENARYVRVIHKLTITDEHTGLYNTRHLGFILDAEVNRSERYGYEFSILCIQPEALNDLKKSLTYALFTQLMNELGQAIKNQLRLIDFGFYFGAGEFMVLLPQTGKEKGHAVAGHLHKLFQQALWLQQEGQNIRLPARVALAAFPEDGRTKADLLHALDEAMYLLKKASKDGIA